MAIMESPIRLRLAGVGLCLIAVFCFWVSCSRALPRSRFVALYDAEHENGSEVLELRDDGTYVHRFKAKDSSESQSSGRWELATLHGSQTVLLHGFVPYFPSHSTSPPEWSLQPQEDDGLIRLYVSQQPRHFYLELPRR